jgi:hypothetical protein
VVWKENDQVKIKQWWIFFQGTLPLEWYLEIV